MNRDEIEGGTVLSSFPLFVFFLSLARACKQALWLRQHQFLSTHVNNLLSTLLILIVDDGAGLIHTQTFVREHISFNEGEEKKKKR